jgi:hypothetical protein
LLVEMGGSRTSDNVTSRPMRILVTTGGIAEIGQARTDRVRVVSTRPTSCVAFRRSIPVGCQERGAAVRLHRSPTDLPVGLERSFYKVSAPLFMARLDMPTNTGGVC